MCLPFMKYKGKIGFGFRINLLTSGAIFFQQRMLSDVYAYLSPRAGGLSSFEGCD